MSTRVRDVLMRQLDELRHEPAEKRIRATLGDQTVIDSTRAMLVWEPKRVVPTYAVPAEDIDGEIGVALAEAEQRAAGIPAMGAPDARRPRGARSEHPLLGAHRRRRATDGPRSSR